MNQPLEVSFRDWFDAACRGTPVISEPCIELARGFRYVFVSGYHNEIMPLYFRGNVRELRRLGISSENIHRLHPTSHATSETVVEWVAASIERLARQGPERLVIIAHSRGACLTLAAALRHAGWFRERVDALFLIQGPFGGTVVANYVVEKEKGFPNTWPARRIGLARSFSSIQRFALRMGWDASLRELTRDAARRFWAEEIRQHMTTSEQGFDAVDRMAYFITSSIESRKLRFPRSELGQIIQEDDGPNDGVIALADQSIDRFGTRFEPLAAAHTDLIWGVYATPGSRNHRRALIQAIIRVVAERHGIDGADDKKPSG